MLNIETVRTDGSLTDTVSTTRHADRERVV
jgi:hypothetical protein